MPIPDVPYLLNRSFGSAALKHYQDLVRVTRLANMSIVATMDTLNPTPKDMAMKVMTARDAKNHFGEFLDSARREPVVVTKNDRPVGIMISVEDAADTLFADLFVEKESGYDEWLFGKVSTTMDRVNTGKTELREHSDAMALMKGRLEARLRKSA